MGLVICLGIMDWYMGIRYTALAWEMTTSMIYE